jgi:hypothetical protein
VHFNGADARSADASLRARVALIRAMNQRR